MNDRYLTAVIRVPIRLTLEGGLTMMNECSKITIEKMDGDELFTKTGDTVFSKVVEYLERELGGEEGSLQDKSLSDKSLEKAPELEPKEIKFTYFKKSKKPMNVTFRERNKSQNFTKKVYSP